MSTPQICEGCQREVVEVGITGFCSACEAAASVGTGVAGARRVEFMNSAAILDAYKAGWEQCAGWCRLWAHIPKGDLEPLVHSLLQSAERMARAFAEVQAGPVAPPIREWFVGEDPRPCGHTREISNQLAAEAWLDWAIELVTDLGLTSRGLTTEELRDRIRKCAVDGAP